jgi:hypothetical protein
MYREIICGKMFAIDEAGGMWKEEVVVYINVVSWHLFEELRKTTRNLIKDNHYLSWIRIECLLKANQTHFCGSNPFSG